MAKGRWRVPAAWALVNGESTYIYGHPPIPMGAGSTYIYRHPPIPRVLVNGESTASITIIAGKTKDHI